MQTKVSHQKLVALGAATYLVAAAIALVVTQLLKLEYQAMALVIGAILGTGAAAMPVYYQKAEDKPTNQLKTALSVAFAICAIVFTLVAQLVVAFPQATVTMIIGALGSAAFPQVLFDKFAQAKSDK